MPVSDVREDYETFYFPTILQILQIVTKKANRNLKITHYMHARAKITNEFSIVGYFLICSKRQQHGTKS